MAVQHHCINVASIITIKPNG